MNDTLLMHVLKPLDHASTHELCLYFSESLTLSNMKAKVTTCQQICNQVQILTILERVVYVDEKWVLQLL